MATPDEVLLVEARLLDQVSPAVKKFSKNTRTALNKMSKDAERMNKKFVTMASKVINVKNAIIGLAAVKGLQLLLGNVAKLGDNFDKMSQRLNVTTQFLQEMDFVANLAGTSFQQLEGGMRRLARNANDANDGLAASKRAFDDIGVSVQGANGQLKTSEQLFNDTLEGLAGLEDKTKQTALAQVLFGRSGASLIPILNQGADAIKAQRQQVNDLGGVMGASAIKAAVDYTDSMTRLSFAFRGLQANLVAPTLAKISEEVEKFIANGGIDKIKRGVELLIEAGKIFFVIFAANKLIAMSSAFMTLAGGVTSFGVALKGLNINPVIATITAAMVAMALLQKSVEKTSENLNKLSDTFGDLDKEQKLLSLRQRFDRLKASGQDVVVTMGYYGSEIRSSSDAMRRINKEAIALQGFTFASKEGQRQTVALLEKRLQVTKAVNSSEGGGGASPTSPTGDNSAAIASAKKLADDVDNIRIAGLQRSFAGRMQILDEQEAMLVERAMGSEEQLDIIRREFAQRHLDEVQSEADRRLEIEEGLASDLAEIEKKSAEEGASLKKKMDDIRDKENAKALAKEQKSLKTKQENLKVQADGQRALVDATISQGARGLQALAKNEKDAQKIALVASVVQGFLAVQRALASPPGPPFTIPGAVATGILAAGNSAGIASQAFADGGFPVGSNVNALLNERGQESVLNAGATARAGSDTINRMNAGRGTSTVTNEISYSPTFTIGQDSNQDFIDILKRDKEGFASFLQEEVIDKGYLEVSQ